MIYTDVLHIYSQAIEIEKSLKAGMYDKAQDQLMSLAKELLMRKDTSNLEWKLKISEIMLIGVVTPLRVMQFHDAHDLEITEETAAFILSEVENLQTGLACLLIPSEAFKYKIYPN